MDKKTAMSGEWAMLIQKAMEAQKRSHAPYSRFHVGAALEDESGKIFLGCNVENSNYSESLCAERVAVVKMVSEGSKRVKRIAVITSSDEPCFPCGSCLQVLQEFGSPQVLAMDAQGEQFKELKFDALLPYRFSGEQLK